MSLESSWRNSSARKEKAVVMMDGFLARDVYNDFLYKSNKVLCEKPPGKVFRRFYTRVERVIPSGSDLYHGPDSLASSSPATESGFCARRGE